MSKLIINLPSPLQKIEYPIFTQNNKDVWVKRDDLIHPIVSGNKWRKLKPYLEEFQKESYKGIVSLGGAFSNHLTALSYVCKAMGIKCKLYVRGEEDYSNPITSKWKSWGAEIIYVSREDFRTLKDENLQMLAPEYYVIPMGGEGFLAENNCELILSEIQNIHEFEAICVSCGTGTTAKGILQSMYKYCPQSKLYVFNALKDDYLSNNFLGHNVKCSFVNDYHFGGFGKTKTALIDFINDFYNITRLPLDPVYNGKLIFGLVDMMTKGLISESKLLWIHTGGLQGREGHNYLNPQRRLM